jgi:tetratricopeptide (TPR) repeat protein
MRLRFRIGDWLQSIAGPDGAYAVGRRYARNGNYEGSIAVFAQAEREYATRLGPASPRVIDAMAQRAYCLIALGRLPEGVELYERALEAKLDRPDDGPPPLDQLRRLLADARQRLALDRAQPPVEGESTDLG